MSAHFLRGPINVPEAIERDRIVRRLRQIRAQAVLDKNTYEHWNRLHPDEEQIDTSWCDEVIAWCDGEGPLPKFADQKDGRGEGG